MAVPLVAVVAETEDVVAAGVVALLDVAVVPHSSADETFLECKLCGEWEGHEEGCPVPALEAWLARS